MARTRTSYRMDSVPTAAEGQAAYELPEHIGKSDEPSVRHERSSMANLGQTRMPLALVDILSDPLDLEHKDAFNVG